MNSSVAHIYYTLKLCHNFIQQITSLVFYQYLGTKCNFMFSSPLLCGCCCGLAGFGTFSFLALLVEKFSGKLESSSSSDIRSTKKNSSSMN